MSTTQKENNGKKTRQAKTKKKGDAIYSEFSQFSIGRSELCLTGLKFRNETLSAIINGRINVVENPYIPCLPYAPGHEDDDLHDERDP